MDASAPMTSSTMEAETTPPLMGAETPPLMAGSESTPPMTEVETTPLPPMTEKTTKTTATLSKAEARRRLDDFKLNKNANGPKSSHRCDYCMNIVARGVSHKCCFSMLIVNLVAIIVGFGVYVAKRVSAELLKYIAEHEGTPRGVPMMLATGN